MGKLIELIHHLEKQRSLQDPFYRDYWDRVHKIEKSMEMMFWVGTKEAELIPKLDISVDALWFKYQETEYFLTHVDNLTHELANRTGIKSVETSGGPSITVKIGIDSDRVAFEFNGFLNAAKGACDKIAVLSSVIMAAHEGVINIQGLKNKSIHQFVNSARKMEDKPILHEVIEAWDSWISDLNDCRDYIEHHGRYFMYAVHPILNFPIIVPPPGWLKKLTRREINSLSTEQLPLGNIDLSDYCSQTTEKIRQLIIRVLDQF